MEKCPKCSNKLSHVDVLCPKCGALVEDVHLRLGLHEDDLKTEPAGRIAVPKQPEDKTGVLKTDNDPSASKNESPGIEPLKDNAQGFHSAQNPSANSYAGNDTAFPEKPAAHRDKLLSSVHGADAQSDAETKPEPANRPAHRFVKPPEEKAGQEPAANRRQWLELMELGASGTPLEPEPAASTEPPAAPVTQEDVAASDTEPETETRQYRYRSKRSAPQKEQIDTFREQQPKERPKRPVVLIVVVWVLLTAALFAGFYFLNNYVMSAYGSYPAFFQGLTGGRIDFNTNAALADSIAVTVDATQTEDGKPAHSFDVAAAGGTSVRLLPLDDVYEMADGKVSFTVADQTLAEALGIVTFEDTYVSDNINLIVNIFSQEIHYQVEPQTLTLASAVYKRNAPKEAYTTTTEKTITIDLSVSPDGSVFVNNTDYTSQIDKLGNLTLLLPLDTVGDNYYIVNVLETGCKNVKDSFTVLRELPKATLTPDITYLRIYQDAFESTGLTLPGATVTATSNGQVFTATADNDGKYTLSCSLKDTGLSIFGIKAVSEGWSDGEATVAIERLPEHTAFLARAQEMTIAEAAKKLSSLNERALQLTGRIENLETSLHIKSFDLSMDNSNLKCYYHGTAELENGNTYRVYGTPNAKTNSFYVMFVG